MIKRLYNALCRHAARIRALCRSHPRRALAVGVGLAVCLAGLCILLSSLGYSWQPFALAEAGLSVKLPGRPRFVTSASSRSSGVYELKTDAMAVVIAGGERTANAGDAAVVAGTMSYLGTAVGLEDLDYQVTQRQHNGQPCMHVSGTFSRNGVSSRLVGLFFASDERQAHVICLYTGSRGARQTARVLASVRFRK